MKTTFANEGRDYQPYHLLPASGRDSNTGDCGASRDRNLYTTNQQNDSEARRSKSYPDSIVIETRS